MAKYTIRDATREDIPGIAILRNAIEEFRPIPSEEYISFWNNFITDNPNPECPVQVALSEENDIVAHYAMVPFRFMKEGEELVGGFLCQLMVHEKFRKELIFPRMEMKFLKDYKKLGFNFAFSLGNRKDVVKAHLSFGFTRIGELPVYAKPYKLSGIAAQKINNNALNTLLKPFLSIGDKLLAVMRAAGKADMEVIEVTEFDSTIDPFLEKVQDRFPYSSLRNSAILKWRFAGSDSAKYHVLVAKEGEDTAGFVVLRRMNMNKFDVLAIVDILFEPDRTDVGTSLLKAVDQMALKWGVEMSACMLNYHDPMYPVLKKCGYIKTPETFALFVHEPKGTDPRFSEKTFNKWHLTWFDNDAV